jgi:hypothetical protein
VDWEAAFNDARRTGQNRVLLLGLSLLNQVYGLNMSELFTSQASELPPLLIETSLRALKDPEEPIIPETSPSSFRTRLRVSRHDKLLRPGREWS